MKTMTDAENWRFTFTVTDLARFLGKSPVTVRGWEKAGVVVLPRDSGGDRKFTTSDIRHVASIAHNLGRINDARFQLISASMTMIELIERENSK